jgi:hypothetical protein
MLWLGAPRGEPLSRSLRPNERAALDDALTLLHANGFVHGAIDRGAVIVGTDGPVLLFPSGDHDGSAALDRAALEAL